MRFPEFSGEWEKCKVFDLLDFYSTNSLAWEQLEYGAKGLKNLHYGLIHNGLATCVDVDAADLPTIKESCVPKKYTLCKEGDVAFADASEDTNDVAKCVEFTNCTEDNMVCGLHTIHGRDKSSKTVIGFKGYAFSAQSFRHQIRRLAQGTKIYSINSKNFSECFIGIPSKEEQSKIATLLYLIDQRIETQKKIIEKYESLIRGLYHSVFNQPASTLQLKDVVSVVKGKQVNGEELLEYGKYYVMNGGIEPSGYLDVCNTPANTISISEGGNSCGYVQYNTEPFWSGGHCYSLIQKGQSVNYQYLYHFLKYKERDIMALRIGSGLPNVQKKDLERFEIRVLPTKQQNRVTDILEDVSVKCDLEKRILQGWQCQKSYLLRNLFI